MISFIIDSIWLGTGLAMDAFSVSLADGLTDPGMGKGRQNLIAGTYAFFQCIMPLIGWFCVTGAVQYFKVIGEWVPTIAFLLLLVIGGKMVFDGLKGEELTAESGSFSVKRLLLQGVATSLDALSVGFTLAEYSAGMAVLAALLIALVTYLICLGGLAIGRRFGTRLAGRAQLLGGLMLIAIGIKIRFFG